MSTMLERLIPQPSPRRPHTSLLSSLTTTRTRHPSSSSSSSNSLFPLQSWVWLLVSAFTPNQHKALDCGGDTICTLIALQSKNTNLSSRYVVVATWMVFQWNLCFSCHLFLQTVILCHSFAWICLIYILIYIIRFSLKNIFCP